MIRDSVLIALRRQIALFACLCLLLSSCRIAPVHLPARLSWTSTPILIPPTAVSASLTSTTPTPFITAMTWQIGTSTPSATTRRTATYTPTATIDPLSCLPALDNSQYAQVKRVQDGETIIVDIADGIYSVRYLGIQTSGYRPIIAENGPDALRANIALVSDQIVQLIPDGMDKNASGQLLRYVVLVGSHRFVNYELARLGYARAAPDISSLMCGKMLARAETLARQDQLGIWSPTLTPRPSRTPTPTRTSRPTTTLKPTDNLTQTAIFLLTHTATATLTATSTPTATITITPTITPTGTLTSTLTATPTGSLTPSPNPSVTVAGTLTTQP